VAIETSSKISLISKALILIGETPLDSLSDNRYGAQVGSNLFEILYENELQSNRWRFAMRKNSLSRLVDTPLNEWAYAYQLPSDMLLPIGVYPRAPYEIYADHLYTDEISVEMDYMFKPAVSEIPAYFAALLVYSLARDMVKPITESDNAVQIFEAKYRRQRGIALFADAQGRPSQMIFDSPFTDARGT
jgi:hypothetical protein